MTVAITGDPTILTMIHSYHTTPEVQQAVFDGLRQGLETYGTRMAGHLSSTIHKSVDGQRVTSYSQWDAEASKALFENPVALKESLDWFAPLTKDAHGQDAHVYSNIFTYTPLRT